jgi:hypothetical protein
LDNRGQEMTGEWEKNTSEYEAVHPVEWSVSSLYSPAQWPGISGERAQRAPTGSLQSLSVPSGWSQAHVCFPHTHSVLL